MVVDPSSRNSVAPMSEPLGVALLVILLLAAVVGGLTPDIASAEPLGHEPPTSGAEYHEARSATPVARTTGASGRRSTAHLGGPEGP